MTKYVAQLLSNIDEARVLRDALDGFIRGDIHHVPTEHEKDLAWKLLAKLTTDIARQS